jgi:phosphoserine aminotransferase
MMRKHNFNAGPAILPADVIKQASEAAADFMGSGMSILEISHRSPDFVPLLDEATALVKELIGLSDEYEVLFLTGGASSQFFMTAMNLLPPNGTAAYVDTGSWSSKAIKEAKRFGEITVVASSKESNYNYIPKDYAVPSNASYLHITTNNTIFGTQYKNLPNTSIPLVADMSSDIMSKPIDYQKFSVIYAGAQKNLGPAGVSLVIVKKDALGKTGRDLPSMLNYQTHIDNQSSFNTPPVFPIYVTLLTLRWIKAFGGLHKMNQHNETKAGHLYDALDTNPLFIGTAAKEDRSDMNVTFLLKDESLQKEFLEVCKAADIEGIKGHRSVGGFRASIYNALPVESVQHLIEVMDDFANKKG